MIYPNHNYLGPGNNLDNGLPVDNDDHIAYQHDKEYSSALTKEDIHKADLKAIKRFGYNLLERNDHFFHNLIGAAGLGIKYGIESVTGVLYPSMPGVKRPKNESESSNKEVDMEASSSGQSGSSMPGGTGASVSSVIVRNPSSANNNNIFVFKKTFQIYTGGFKFTKQLVGNGNSFSQLIDENPISRDNYGITTPLAAIIPDIPALYMTPVQYESLPPWTYATECKIKVTPLGYRLPFATNESASTFANSQTLVQICWATGLNTWYDLILASYQTAENDLTNPTAIDDTMQYKTLLYGTDGSIGAHMGIPRHWNYYTTIVNGERTSDIPLLDQMNIQNVNDIKGIPIINYSYTFKNGLLKIPNVSIPRIENLEYAAGRGTIPLGPNQSYILPFDTSDSDIDKSRFSNKLNPANDPSVASAIATYDYLIEKAPFLTRQLEQCQTPDRPPLIHFGCMPVQSNAALSPTPTFSPAVIQWEIQTELICHTHFNYASTTSLTPYIQSYDPVLYDVRTTDISRKYLEANGEKIYISNRYAKLIV